MADVLLLNADAQPVSYLPLSTVPWKEAVSYMWNNKADVVEYYEDWSVRSVNWETKVPAVIMLRDFVKQKTAVGFSRTNVYLRDQYKCQYCGCGVTRTTATLDHVVPLSRGGKTNFENIVTACHSCNSRKADRSFMKPAYAPYKPGYWELVRKRKQLPFDLKHPSWSNWIDMEHAA